MIVSNCFCTSILILFKLFVLVLDIFKFCQCKRGIQRVAPHDSKFDYYSLIVDCDKKELINNYDKPSRSTRKSTKRTNTYDNFDYDSSSQKILSSKVNKYLYSALVLFQLFFYIH